MGLSTPLDAFQLRRTAQTAAAQLPAEWLPLIAEQARAAGWQPSATSAGWHDNAAAVWQRWIDGYGGATPSDLSDSDIKARAEACALEARSMDIGLLGEDPGVELDRLKAFCAARDVAAPADAFGLRGQGARVRCKYWWRRALRKMVARRSEGGAMALGLVSAPARQPYASNKAVWRRVDQNRRNAEALENTFLENEEGYRASLADLAAASTSNKAIRRGELMTRIRGCEAIADECGHPGLFVTLTAPSRFHSTLRNGRPNPKHDPALNPRDAQQWHCRLWAKARAKLARLGIGLYGFRVAEPHHDGCTHWHMLIWSAGDLAQIEAVLRGYWLSDAGDEPGALKYRTAFKLMNKGGAAGYIAKYIAKNIDDHGIESHLDDYAETAIGPDLLGDLEIKPSMRVEAWAATWGIRQFQPLGQPPVTVWRELRRIKESEALKAGKGGMVHRAWCAAQRVGGVLADWARYVLAQGGMMKGRAARIVMRTHKFETEGLYGPTLRVLPLGVALNVKTACTVWSERKLWRSVEVAPEFKPAKLAPRTRVNNCTQPLTKRQRRAQEEARGVAAYLSNLRQPAAKPKPAAHPANLET